MATATRIEGRGGVRAYQQDSPGGGGSGGAPPVPPAGSGLPGTGGGGSPPATGGAAVPPAVVPMDVLPRELQGKSEAEIRMTLTGITDALKATNKRNADLQDELVRARRAPPAPPREEAPPKPKSTKPLSDRLLEEPEEALNDYLDERFGSSLKRLDNIDRQLGNTQIDIVRSKVPDFHEHEEQVDRLLGEAPRTQEAIMGAYAMSVGLKAIEDRERAMRASLNSDAPRHEDAPPPPSYSKSTLSEEIRLGLGLSEEDYYTKYAKGGSVTSMIKVPT